MRYGSWLCLLGTTACATSQADKMPWPQDLAARETLRKSEAMPNTPPAGGPITVWPPTERTPSPPEAAEAPSADEDTSLGRGQMRLSLAWPLAATGVTSLYGPRTDPIDHSLRYHYGVDLEAAYGAIVRAAAPGVVAHAGWNAGHGRQVVVQHAAGYQTAYSHLSCVLVTPGVSVAAGQPIGLLGNSGRSTGAHLHFEVSRHGAALDPLDVLGADAAGD